MTAIAESLLMLVGDAFSAAGQKLRDRRTGFDEAEAAAALASGDVVAVSALHDLPDSVMLGLAASIIEGWTPILLREQVAHMTNVGPFTAALRDRAAQFAAIEADAEEPFLTESHLIAKLHTAAEFYPQHRGK